MPTTDFQSISSVEGTKMASGDRFYMLQLRHRPAVYGDLGNILRIEGLVVGGEGAQAILMLPDSPSLSECKIARLSMEEWTDFLARTDNPEIMIMPAKAFHRKVRYEISGAVQQKIWVADGLKCMYCGAIMGDVQLTVDHFVPLEIGGKNDTSNYLSADRRCNKRKGAMSPEQWCREEGLDFNFFVNYLSTRRI